LGGFGAQNEGVILAAMFFWTNVAHSFNKTSKWHAKAELKVWPLTGLVGGFFGHVLTQTGLVPKSVLSSRVWRRVGSGSLAVKSHSTFMKTSKTPVLILKEPVLVTNNIFCEYYDPDKSIGAKFRPVVFRSCRAEKPSFQTVRA